MAGKLLDQPLIVQAALVADRVDITSYRVTIGDTIAVEIAYTCHRTEEDDTLTPVAERTKTVAGEALTAAMVAATGSINGPLLAAAVAAGILAPEAVAALTALVQAQPQLLALAYYNGTRDALYSLL
jgi:protein involved in polysaccharide export with SLBB domain